MYLILVPVHPTAEHAEGAEF